MPAITVTIGIREPLETRVLKSARQERRRWRDRGE
jgi:hypothetical protein